MNKHELEALYTLNDPATSQAIKMLPPEWHSLYPSYLQFLELSNGLFGDEITLLEAEDIQQRNIDYEVKEYLPNFLMIGDNGGGVAILMDNKNQNIFAVGIVLARAPKKTGWVPQSSRSLHKFPNSQILKKPANKPTTTQMEENLIQKRNNGNGAFSWKYYKDNVTVQHRK